MNRWMMPDFLWLCLLLAAFPASLFGQTERWLFTYDGPGHLDDTFPATIVGSDGNLYSAGYGYGAELTVDIIVVSVDPAGSQRWSYIYDNGDHDGANALIHGPDDHLYVVGTSAGPPSETTDLVVICLDTDGAEQWVYRYNGPGNVVDGGYDIHAGADGNICVAGYSGGAGTQYDAVVISLTAGGMERWVYRYDGPLSGQDRAYCLTSDQNDQVYLGGYSTVLSATEQFLVIALDTLGAEQWVYTDSCPFAHQNAAYALTLDPAGDLLAVGTSGAHDFAVLKIYWKTGELLWHYTWPTATFNQNRANAVVCGNDGNIYVAGSIEIMLTMNDFVVLSLDGDGNQRWVYGYNGTANLWDEAWSLTCGSDGTLFAAGLCHMSSTSRDALVVSLDPDGSFNWRHRINGSADLSDNIDSAAWGDDGHLYVGGYICNDQGRDLLLAKIDPDNTVSAEIVCSPLAGTLPFDAEVLVDIFNRLPGQVRRASARVDVELAGGWLITGWRQGYMNIQPDGVYSTSLHASLPLSPWTVGENSFRLVVQDTTPPPYNQPPYRPSGDTDTALGIVTGYSSP